MAYGVILGQSFGEGLNAKLYVNATSDTASLTEVRATGVNTGNVYNGVYNSTLQYFIIDIPVYDVYTVSANLSGQAVLPAEVTIDTAERKYVSLASVTGSLNDNSWATIRAVSDAGVGESLWSVGDAKQITISGDIGISYYYNNYQPWVYILGFNHNASLEGNNRIHFGCFRSEESYTSTNSVAMIDDEWGNSTSTTLAFHMNKTNTNVGGWKDSLMRKQLLNADAANPNNANNNTFLQRLPSDLKTVLKQCTKYTDNVANGEGNVQLNVTSTQDWCFLLSVFEVTGETGEANSYEQDYQKQYQYYIDGNSTVKKAEIDTADPGSPAAWWLRSPRSQYDGGFLAMDTTNQTETRYYSRYSLGLAPAFCV